MYTYPNRYPRQLFAVVITCILPFFLSAQTIDLSKPVGTPAGTGGVGATGSSNYVVPINLLPGINRLLPDVKLVYSSQGGDGVAGWGWNLSCLSLISRAGKNNYYNGITSPVNYTNSNDAFMLDGQRMFVTTGSNGGDGAAYGLENENFAKIESFGTTAQGPAWFRVTMKNGTVMEYGHTASSTMPTDDGTGNIMLWFLDKITDINGNVVNFFTFVNPSDRSYALSEIQYGGDPNSPMPVYNRIVFNYDVRTDWSNSTTYNGGASLRNAFILKGINIINTSGQTARSYAFTHDLIRNQYFLRTVTEKGSDGTAFNPLNFTYGSNTSAPDVALSLQYSNMHQGNVYAGDFNGDGKQDVLQANYYYDNNNIPHYTSYDVLSDFSSYGGQPAISFYYNFAIPQGGATVEVQNARLYNPKLNYDVVGTFDYDGDGKEDVLMLNSTISGSDRLYSGIRINYSRYYNVYSGPTYDSALYNSLPTAFPYPGSFRYIYRSGTTFGSYFVPGDFDGDGAQDYILIVGLNSSNAFKGFFSSPKKGIFNQEILQFGVEGTTSDPFYANSIASARQLIPIDFDGDGKQEILVVKDNQSYVLSVFPVSATTGYNYAAQTLYSTTAIVSNYPVFRGDFNGDGKTDLLYRSANTDANATWYVMYSTGKVFSQQVFNWVNRQYLPQDGAGSANHLMLADLNGDGKTDVWQSLDVASPQQSRHNLYFSNGRSFVAESYYSTFGINGSMQANTVVGDFNGDGKPDILGINSSSQGRFIYPKPFKEDRFLTSVTNGLGVQEGFNYLLTNDGSVYSRSASFQYDVPGIPIGYGVNGNPYNVLSYPMYVVSQYYKSNGLSSGLNYMYYQYTDAAYHRIRGFLGYGSLKSTDGATGILSATENSIDPQWLVAHPVHQYSTLFGTTISDIRITDALQQQSTSYLDKRYSYQILKTLQYNGTTDAAVESTNTYDSYGNITQNVSKAGALSGTTVTPVETSTTSTVFGTHGTPYPSSPESVTLQNVRSGEAQATKTTTYTYNTKGLPITKTEFSGLPKAVMTAYTYDNSGNVTQSDVTAAGVATRTQKFTYDNSGRFLLQKETLGSGISKKEVFTYETMFGNAATKLSADGLTTSYQYDVFGRLSATTLPEGYAVTQMLGWESTNGRYYMNSTRPGGGRNVKVFYDLLGREVRRETSGFSNGTLIASKTYNTQGLESSSVDPHYVTETAVTTNTYYDSYNRVSQQSNGTTSTSYTYVKPGGGQYQTTATNSAGQSTITTSDATGKTVAVSDNGGALSYSYNSQGKQTQAIVNGVVVGSSGYDAYANQVSQTDKNAGSYNYDYDALGELVSQTTPSGTTTMTYDPFGRILTRTGTEGTTTYEYWTEATTGYCNDDPARITGFAGDVREYTYDNLRRPVQQQVTTEGTAYITQYGYDGYSNLIKTTYPSGVVITRAVDHDGTETAVSLGEGAGATTLFSASAMNGLGKYTAYAYGNGKSTTEIYDAGLGALTHTVTSGIQDLSFTFDAQTGNLTNRKDNIRNLTESFTYDNLNRLLTTAVNSVQQLSLSYDGNPLNTRGNIVTKTDAGNYVYDNQRINAVNYITNPAGAQTPPAVISQQQQDITYTAFQKPATLSQNNFLLTYTYSSDQQRMKGVLTQGGSAIETRYYFGSYEKQVKGGITRELHYILAGNGLCAIIDKEGGSVNVYYTYTDYLGSILAVTNSAGVVVASQNFDAWGRTRNPDDWSYNNVPVPPDWLYRGYTGHEHLAQFVLINMNGRLYDPVEGRMLSPDNFVSIGGNTQGYNRYAYALNNPLRITDPNGEWIHILIGAIVGGVINLAVHAINGEIHDFGDGAKAFLVGAVAGAAAAATGGATLAATGLTGASVAGGALAGFSGSLVSSPILGIGNNLAFGDPYRPKDLARDVLIGTIGGAVVGGTTAYFKGNNIWTGAPIGDGRTPFSLDNSPMGDDDLTNTGPNPPGANNPPGTTSPTPEGTTTPGPRTYEIGTGPDQATIEHADGTKLILKGDNISYTSKSVPNLLVKVNPKAVWSFIISDPTGTLSQNMTVFQTSELTFNFYIAKSSQDLSIQVFSKVSDQVILKIRF